MNKWRMLWSSMIILGLGSIGWADSPNPMDVNNHPTMNSTVPAHLTAAGMTQKEEQEFNWNGKIARGHAIRVIGVNGDVTASLASADEVRVRAIKRGPRNDLDRVRIEVSEDHDDVTIRVVHPRYRSGKVSVNFSVEVPAGVRFVGHTVDGRVEAASLASDVEAQSVNGSIEISTTGSAEAETVNGSIKASMGSSYWEKSLEFETVNGSITVRLPDGAGAELRAKTVNGSIRTEFPITVRGRIKKKHLRGTIGEGGGVLRLETVNGGIRILRSE